MPKYIVARGVGGSFEGQWRDYDTIPTGPVRFDKSLVQNISKVTLSPTGKYETRDDGARAEVYRPA